MPSWYQTGTPGQQSARDSTPELNGGFESDLDREVPVIVAFGRSTTYFAQSHNKSRVGSKALAGPYQRRLTERGLSLLNMVGVVT